MTRFVFLAALLAPVAPIVSQVPLADSLAHLNAAGKWQLTIAAARPVVRSITDTTVLCNVELQMLVAYDRLGRLDEGATRLATFDDGCAKRPIVRTDAVLLQSLRRDLTLPALPESGLDFSGIDRFWKVVDTLTADREPSEMLWHSMFATPGYRLAFFNVQPLRSDLEIAFRPSRAHERDSILASSTDDASRIRHIALALTLRASLNRVRDSLRHGAFVKEAVAAAGHYLPANATAGAKPPMVAFAIFREDAYATSTHTVVVDLIRASEGGLDLLVGHEFHHAFLARVTKVPRVTDDSADALVVNMLINLDMEGLADLVDKSAMLAHPPEGLVAYAARYRRESDSAVVTLRAIDAVLSHLPHDRDSLRNAGNRVAALLWSGGHPVGGYMARRIYDTFGVDSIAPAVYSPFGFFRTYMAAERVHGVASPFSDATQEFLKWEEERYAVRVAPRGAN